MIFPILKSNSEIAHKRVYDMYRYMSKRQTPSMVDRVVAEFRGKIGDKETTFQKSLKETVNKETVILLEVVRLLMKLQKEVKVLKSNEQYLFEQHQGRAISKSVK